MLFSNLNGLKQAAVDSSRKILGKNLGNFEWISLYCNSYQHRFQKTEENTSTSIKKNGADTALKFSQHCT